MMSFARCAASFTGRLRQRLALALPAAFVVMSLASPTGATVTCHTATLAAPSLVCETATSPHTGSAFFALDDVAHTLTFDVSFTGLTSAETAAHIHGPDPGTGCAGILIGLPLGNPKMGTVPTGGAANEGPIVSGMSYINIHSMMFTGGELRGQLVAAACPTPTPVATPTETPTPEPTPICAAAPIAGCRTPSESNKASIAIIDKGPDSAKDILMWKWLKGSATAKADFGSPLTTTSYTLCIYDSTPTVIVDGHVAAGGMCGSKPKPCWKEDAKGFQYKNNLLTPDGIEQLKLKEGLEAGKAQIQVKGKGALLDDPTFPVSQPATVQLVNSDGVCWEAVYSAPATKNEIGPPGQFKDKGD